MLRLDLCWPVTGNLTSQRHQGGSYGRTSPDAKLYIPTPHPNFVPRPHLLQRLDKGLESGHRLTLISAPAGFGKTTLVTRAIATFSHVTLWLDGHVSYHECFLDQFEIFVRS